MTEETNTTESNEEVAPQLSISDIMLFRQIVEVASARGAFRANELTQIGGAYDRVSAWLDSVAPPESLSDDDDSQEAEHNSGEENA